MRLWSLHPRYLDTAGLTACWREGLLAKKVLEGNTKGYRNHPQLARFKEQSNPQAAIHTYLHAIVDEAEARHYNFDRAKLLPRTTCPKIEVTDEQLAYEWQHLLGKLAGRSPELHKKYQSSTPSAHSSFTIIPGPIASWEKKD